MLGFGEFQYNLGFADRGVVFGHLVNVGPWRIPWILFYRVFRGCWFSVDLENVGFRVDSVELCFFGGLGKYWNFGYICDFDHVYDFV